MNFTKADIKAIETILKNWHIVERALNTDILNACKGMASKPDMSTEEMHFRRGAVFAANNMVTLAQKLKTAADSQTAMESLLIKDDKR